MEETPIVAESASPKKKNIVIRLYDWVFSIIRRLYDWVLSWADTKYGTPALFTVAFFESSVFPVPPDALQIPLSAAKPRRAFWYATVSLAGSVAGAFLGFLIGYLFWAATQDFFYNYVFSRETFAVVAGDKVAGIVRDNPEDVVLGLYHEHAFWAILISAPTPVPYKVFTIAAGVCEISLWVLLIASIFGRGARFYAVATVMYFYGPTVVRWIDKYFNLMMVLFAVLVIIGLVALVYIKPIVSSLLM
jgi:membrane protein YqaA with SNARE-associated domain